MITDAHAHILYDIDDGASDVGESLKLLQMEIDSGIDTVVLTPHFDPHKDSLDIFAQKCRERVDMLSRLTKGKNITLIPGSETFYSSLLLYYSALKQLCVSGTRYLLVEFSPDIKFNKPFFAEFEKLIIKFDIIPIIAHAERYKHIQKRVNVIEKFKNLGCIVQINADYIIHNTGEKFVKRLFESGYIDMVASDCHDAEKRRPNLREAIDVINEKYNGYYDRILANKYKFIKQKKD